MRTLTTIEIQEFTTSLDTGGSVMASYGVPYKLRGRLVFQKQRTTSVPVLKRYLFITAKDAKLKSGDRMTLDETTYTAVEVLHFTKQTEARFVQERENP
jgi:hypothetical protein